MVDEEADAFRYLSYATIREVWDETKGTFIAWLVLSAVCAGFGVLMEAGVSATQSFWSSIPKPFMYIIGFGAFAWVVRGQEFKFVFPKTFKLWLFMTIAVAGVSLASEFLPTWAAIPVYFAFVLSASALDSLGRIGKKNYQRLNGVADDSALIEGDDEA